MTPGIYAAIGEMKVYAAQIDRPRIETRTLNTDLWGFPFGAIMVFTRTEASNAIPNTR